MAEGTLGEDVERGGTLGYGGASGRPLVCTRGSVDAEAVRGYPSVGVAVVEAEGMV